MVTIDNLLNLAARAGIKIMYYPFPDNIKGYALHHHGEALICLNVKIRRNSAEFKTVLAEELGHHLTATGSAVIGSHSDLRKVAILRKQESLGLSWQANYLVPTWDLEEAIMKGNDDEWSLAEYFGVTPLFMRRRLNMADAFLLQAKAARRQA